MKDKNGFTLIELLAVIIILGILMIIAIPSVTRYISDSRKSAYVDTAREIIGGARNVVNDGKLGMFDTDATYYIPSSYIKTENASKSPYGEFTEAYVVVIYNGKGYNYYWTSVDDAGEGIKDIVAYDKLETDNVESDLTNDMIDPNITKRGVGERSKILVLDPNTETWKEVVGGATTKVPEEGGNGGTTPVSNKICRRATSLHTATCSRTSDGCYGAGYYSGGSKNTTTITYGNLGTSGSLQAGDAFDCDVNADGKYDAATERFYYISDYYDVNAETPGLDTSKATLIYYTNVTGGTTPTQTNYAYYASANENWHGPVTVAAQLPSTTQWSNGQIIAPGTRQIRNEAGATTTYKGSRTIESFTYEGKAARLLTTQELVAGCSSLSSLGSFTPGELNGCNYLMENVGQYESNSGANGYWFETPRGSTSFNTWLLNGIYRRVNNSDAKTTGYDGVRPVITVLKSNISY